MVRMWAGRIIVLLVGSLLVGAVHAYQQVVRAAAPDPSIVCGPERRPSLVVGLFTSCVLG